MVGRTGAGKSSIALAVFRLLDQVEGSIIIDDNDISKIDLARHRSKITIIPQDPALFNGTLRFNLDPEYRFSDYHIWECLRGTNLADFISKFPEGLDYVIDSDGTVLSEGEQQLLCCIRGLLSKKVILKRIENYIDQLCCSFQRNQKSLFWMKLHLC